MTFFKPFNIREIEYEVWQEGTFNLQSGGQNQSNTGMYSPRGGVSPSGGQMF